MCMYWFVLLSIQCTTATSSREMVLYIAALRNKITHRKSGAITNKRGFGFNCH